MDDRAITGAIIGAAMEVHNLLGPRLLESTYEECLAREFELRGIHYDRQKAVPVVYKDVKLDCGYRIDLVVEGQVVVELKAVESLAKIHEAIVLTYLRLSGCRIGLLINFNVLALKQGIRRFRI
jgi:GxxExxY protein